MPANPFIAALFAILRPFNVELTDFAFNNNAANIGETHLNISIRKLNAVVRIGLDTVTLIVANPDWDMAPQLIPVFEAVSGRIREIVRIEPEWQETTLAFHVTPGAADFRATTASLVNPRLTGESLFCGISLHRSDGTLIIDKSLKYEGAAFVRLQRRLPGNATFSDVTTRLFEDEVAT